MSVRIYRRREVKRERGRDGGDGDGDGDNWRWQRWMIFFI